MTKSESRAVNRIGKLLFSYHGGFIDCGDENQSMIAASLSALVRSAMTAKSANELRALAAAWGVATHPAYIV